MKQSDLPEFVAILTGLAAIKPGGKLSREALKVWELAMRDWQIEDFREAASHLARSVEFMPSPFHFEELQKAGRPTAGEAWTQIRQMARGSLTGEPDDPAAAKALRAIGGLRAVGMCDFSKIEFMERRFAEHFEAIQDADDVREAVPQIAGHASTRITGPVDARQLAHKLLSRART